MKYPSTFTVTLKDGIWTMSHTGAEAETDTAGTPTPSRATASGSTGPLTPASTFTYSVDGKGDLHLTPVQPMDPGDAFVWTTHPWTKIG